MKLVWDKIPTKNNGRNSEGSFIRLKNKEILFAYSRYNSDNPHDGASCDIAAIRSKDEGETWSEPEVIVTAKTFGVSNIMSVSAIYQNYGKIGIYFIIKENNGDTSIGRVISDDGYAFTPERCEMGGPAGYFVFNNDRFIRLNDGRIAAPASLHLHRGPDYIEDHATAMLFVSDDDGKSFSPTAPRLTIPKLDEHGVGLQEPGVIENKDGTIRMWMRTKEGYQFESYSRDGGNSFTMPAASVFTSPDSPLEIMRYGGVSYAAYNPVPKSNFYVSGKGMPSRTPFVIRKSTDDGRTWGPMNMIEDDKDRGYCYPAMFITDDNSMLCAYCRGTADFCLKELGIMKIALDELE